jgi:hypothetical protein
MLAILHTMYHARKFMTRCDRRAIVTTLISLTRLCAAILFVRARLCRIGEPRNVARRCWTEKFFTFNVLCFVECNN